MLGEGEFFDGDVTVGGAVSTRDAVNLMRGLREANARADASAQQVAALNTTLNAAQEQLSSLAGRCRAQERSLAAMAALQEEVDALRPAALARARADNAAAELREMVGRGSSGAGLAFHSLVLYTRVMIMLFDLRVLSTCVCVCVFPCARGRVIFARVSTDMCINGYINILPLRDVA